MKIKSFTHRLLYITVVKINIIEDTHNIIRKKHKNQSNKGYSKLKLEKYNTYNNNNKSNETQIVL